MIESVTANASYVPARLIKPDKPDRLGDLTHEIVSCLFSHLESGGSFKKKTKKNQKTKPEQNKNVIGQTFCLSLFNEPILSQSLHFCHN